MVAVAFFYKGNSISFYFFIVFVLNRIACSRFSSISKAGKRYRLAIHWEAVVGCKKFLHYAKHQNSSNLKVTRKLVKTLAIFKQ